MKTNLPDLFLRLSEDITYGDEDKAKLREFVLILVHHCQVHRVRLAGKEVKLA